MIGVIGYWDNQTWIYKGGAEKTLISFWRLTMKAFGGSHLVFIDKDRNNPICNDLQITYEVFSTILEALEVHKDKNLVFIEQKKYIPDTINAIPLHSFQHPPEDVFYIVGPDYGSLDTDIFTLYSSSNFVYIPNVLIPLWAHVTTGVVLYDRLIKTTN